MEQSKAHWESKAPTNTLVFHKKMSGFTLLAELSRHAVLTAALASGTITENVDRAAGVAPARLAGATGELRVTVIAKGAPTQGARGREHQGTFVMRSDAVLEHH